MLATACQMFMGKSEGEIANIALETLEGHQRAIIAHLTVEVGRKRITSTPTTSRATSINSHRRTPGRHSVTRSQAFNTVAVAPPFLCG